MNLRDLAELRRRLNPDHRNPTLIRGCYADRQGRVISTFIQPVFDLTEEENKQYMALFKKVLSGTPGQQLTDIALDSAAPGEPLRLLERLRASSLKDDEAADDFFTEVLSSLRDGADSGLQSVAEDQKAANVLVLLLCDGYDVPARDVNGEIDRERSEDLFSYILCAMCPVKPGKEALGYVDSRHEFHGLPAQWIAGMPEQGFLYPAWEDRRANVNAALHYSKDIADGHEAFIKAVFGAERPMPAAEQQQAFSTVMQASLGEECSLDVVQAVHETVSTMIAEQQADKSAEPLAFSRQEMRTVLENCGVSPEKAERFDNEYTEVFGEEAVLPAVNLVAPRQFKVETPSVKIQVDPRHTDLIETRVIDGRSYILILADGDVQVNGVQVQL